MPDIQTLGLLAALLAGTVSFLSPCVLPLVPGYVSYIAGSTGPGKAPSRAAMIWLSICFVLGFSTIFIALGASATALGQALLRWRFELNILGGAIVALFGLFMLGAARIRALEGDLRFDLDIPGGQPMASYVLGLAFGFGWTPCIGPILGAILTASAMQATMGEGVALLAVYSVGLGVPFVLVAAFIQQAGTRLRRVRGMGRGLHRIAGAVMVLMGLAMMTGQLTVFSYWLLETVPLLGQIG
ncbi:cytochrome c biogenesis CcdA family protein [Limimaricola sp. AA108-03]|jgi:cytochrome c-type biogenesis protein|uniref:cytochrome c biogenesis CcdA family protein n=1 Tax=Limimaricola sp. AA108-03 TaxID=3425945 RepID=UPI003D77E4A6